MKHALDQISKGAHKKVDWRGGHSGGIEQYPPNPLKKRHEPVKPLFLARFSSAWVFVCIATVGVSLFEKQKKYELAVEILLSLLGGNCCPSRRGYWWERLTTNLEKHLNRPQEALEVK